MPSGYPRRELGEKDPRAVIAPVLTGSANLLISVDIGKNLAKPGQFSKILVKRAQETPTVAEGGR